MNIKELLQTNTVPYKSHPYGNRPGYEYTDSITPLTERAFIESYKLLADGLHVRFPNCHSVLELGAGCGCLSYYFRQIQKPGDIYVTTDINEDSAKEPYNGPNHFYLLSDEPFHLVDGNNKTLTFDLILSFEHFEHINSNVVPVLLNNIKRHCHENTIVVATAAQFHRESHVTLWSKDQWTAVLNESGFEIQNECILTQVMMPFHIKLPGVAELVFRLARK